MASKDDKARVEQIIGECFVKVANIVLTSRVHNGSLSLSDDKAPQKCWFNLKVDELPAAQEAVLQWRRNITQPMFLQIYQLPDETEAGEDKLGALADFNARSEDSETGTLLEVWAIQWQEEKRPAKPQSSRSEPAAIYKRLVIMLRSLFAYVRILPAYKLYRARKRDRACAPAMRYQISSSLSAGSFEAASPAQLERFNFTPIETPFGTLSLGVEHRPSSWISVQQTAPLAAPNPHIIPDYMSGQRLRSTLSADLSSQPPSLLAKGSGEQSRVGPSQQPPPLLRRHSWSLASARGQMNPEPDSGSGLSDSRTSQAGPSDSWLFQGRRDRGTPSSTFAPNTPKAAATPPKYPAGGLAARMARLAGGAGRGVSPSPTGRGSPARSELPHSQELRTFKPPALAATVSRKREPEPEASAAGPSRPTSQPVLIPGCEKGERRRLRSSGDLLGMTHAADGPQTTAARRGRQGADVKPSSAPAASTYIGFQLRDGVDSRQPLKAVEPRPKSTLGNTLLKQPDTPPVLQPLPSLGSESSCSLASSFLASGSPQLPFALTPTTNSYISAADPQRRAEGSVPSGLHPPRKEPPFVGQSLGSEIHPGAVGYSVSPMLDSLSSSLFSSSTPLAAAQLPFSLPSASSSPMPTPKGNSSSGAPACAVEVLLASGDTEADSLPFALDGEAPAASPSASKEPLAATPGTRSLGLQGEPDAAVGAFVRLIQDAPPLRKDAQQLNPPAGRDNELSLADGLEQLSRMRLRISQLASPPSQPQP